jgi:hypothetical protein
VDAGTKMPDLGTVNDTVDNDSYSIGLGINDKGQIVGVSAKRTSASFVGSYAKTAPWSISTVSLPETHRWIC